MKKLDLQKVELLLKALRNNPQIRFKPYGGAASIGVPKGEMGLPVWKEVLGEDLIKYLEDNTYPYGDPIHTIRGNIYSKGNFFNLHIDNVLQSKEEFFNGESKFSLHVTTITLDKTDDLEGGEVVIGDCWELWDYFGVKANMNRKPLEVINPDIGDCIYWDGDTLHGVTEIKKGSRTSLAVIKNG